MKPTILVQSHDAVYNKLIVEPSMAADLSDYFTFKVPGYEYVLASMRRKNPTAKFRWNGDIKLFSQQTGRMYCGLMSRLEHWASERDIDVVYEHEPLDTEYSVAEAVADIAKLGLPDDKEHRDYQVETIVKAVRKGRGLVLSPTASGKSLIIYVLLRYYAVRTLIIVPTVNLVNQLHADFKDYGFDADRHVHRIYEGQSKDTKKRFIISTWQSLMDMPKQWFRQFDAVICDEVHHAQAKVLKSLLSAMTKAELRFGFTGTLDDSLTHRLVLEGLFGPVIHAGTSAQLMEAGYLAPLRIKAITLRHSEADAKTLRYGTYQDEIDWLAANPRRNRFIVNLALSLPGNTLVLFRLVEAHGHGLYDAIAQATDRPVYYIHGGTDADDREAIRNVVQTQSNAIIVGSYGTMSTGVNIPNLDNIIFASPYKSKIKVLQSIGRGLRLAEGKTHCTLFDLADDLSFKDHTNHTLKHFVERIKIYNAEEFDYKTYKVDLT